MVAQSWAVLMETAALVMFSSIFLTSQTNVDLNQMVEFASVALELKETVKFDKSFVPTDTMLPETIASMPNITDEYVYFPALVIPKTRGQVSLARVFCTMTGCSDHLNRYETAWSGDLSTNSVNTLKKEKFLQGTTLDYMREQLDATFYGGGQDAYDLALALKTQQVIYAQEQLDSALAASEAARAAYQSSQATLFFGLAATIATLLLWISLVRFVDSWPRLVLAVIAVVGSFVAGLTAIGIRDGAQEFMFQYLCESPIVSNNTPGQSLVNYRNDRNIFFIRNPDATEYTEPEIVCKATADYRWGFWAVWVGWAFATLGAVAVYFAHQERTMADADAEADSVVGGKRVAGGAQQYLRQT